MHMVCPPNPNGVANSLSTRRDSQEACAQGRKLSDRPSISIHRRGFDGGGAYGRGSDCQWLDGLGVDDQRFDDLSLYSPGRSAA